MKTKAFCVSQKINVWNRVKVSNWHRFNS